MKSIQKLKAVLNAGFLLLLIAQFSLATDLIEPSRTLKSVDQRMGKLSISSDPPMLEVKMNGNAIGETPVVLQEVKPGFHVIQVKDSETEIYVGPGKAIQLSWFNGAFIAIPIETKESPAQPSSAKKEVPRKVTPEPTAKKIQLEPLYWPLDPKGQIF
jgi:hypothetical protein